MTLTIQTHRFSIQVPFRSWTSICPESLIVSSRGDDLLLSGDDLLQAVVVPALGAGNLLALGGQHLGTHRVESEMHANGRNFCTQKIPKEKKAKRDKEMEVRP